ncbi:Hypothetical protein LUCI_3158 [Lucifera butyrica]|uniref:Uncharacterized protein n=1 Tax=Lucifera butyrica TaxID=1351585 RepID=A0A498RCU6_9FIRM|nr:hypothetical protein [Lucifera butyrica]VBB07893.1 Hypothetical protein LUCI_3158 [Lucifera butyrica]
MSEERFDRLEKMLEQLIQMVGHNNAVRMDKLETRMDNLESKVDSGFQQLTSMVTLLSDKVDNIKKTLSRHANMLDVLATRTTHQEAEIQGLKRGA